MSSPNPLKDAALAAVNSEKSWIRANRSWLIAMAIVAAIGFILGHLV